MAEHDPRLTATERTRGLDERGIAQDARLRFERLNLLENKAEEVVEVNIDGKLLDLAKRVMVKVDGSTPKRIDT